MDQFKQEFREVFFSILPVTLVIVLLQVTLIHMPFSDFLQFLLAALLTIVELSLFLFGVKLGLLPIGESLGSSLPHKGFFWVIFFGFLLGFVITVAEPDVRIFAQQIEDAGERIATQNVLILAISLGVGISVVMAMLRSIFNISLTLLLIPSYILVFVLGYFVSDDFFSIALDAGGVTTGPITVPFLMALSIGVVSVFGGRDKVSQGFGMVALASVGPVIAVMVLGVLFS